MIALEHHTRELQAESPEAARVCLESTFMDDAIDSVDSCVEAIKLREELAALLKGAGFVIRRWRSNEESLLETTKILHVE
jgi:hypothetical protein